MEYYNDFSFYGGDMFFEEILGGVGLAIVGVLLVVLLLVAAVSVAMYVLQSLGLYAVAQRRGIRNAWLAWVPVANNWILGCISDQYQYVVKGKVKNRRKILLILSIATTVFSVLSNGIQTAAMISGSEEAILFGSMATVIVAIICGIASIAAAVFYYIALYDLYSSVSPQNNVLFLVLSIVISVTQPFFIFFNRKNDNGMPPRREAPVAEPAPVQEPWENTQA